MPKYAPARDDGKKPYVVTQGGWGKTAVRVAYGVNPSDAKYAAFGRMGVGMYIVGCRRATPEDMAANDHDDA